MDHAAVVATEGMRPLTRAEYDRMVALGFLAGEHVELLHGVIVPMGPQGTRHVYSIGVLDEILLPPLLGRAQVRIQMPFAASDDTEPEPDVAVVPLGDWLDDHPGRAYLVIEVAESSHRRDLVTKPSVYAASGVAEYWVLDLAARTVVCHTDPGSGGYGSVRTIGDDGSLAPVAFPDLVVAVAQILPPR